MDRDGADAVEQAQEVLVTRLDQLVTLVEQGGLRNLDDAGLIRFLQRFERLRDRLLLAESEFVLHAQPGSLSTG
ncbi:MAG TPA: hypothetical protein VE476_09500 [Propionibacteriaceae bacterium]|jgi:hypothetical protein|nr:hypothetical protein [Propionibacteriaceae bacterium]